MIHFLRLFLWPFSLIYGLIIVLRNYLYDRGVFKSEKFDLPVIVIGNLAVGGTGKSPMTEYLIRLLKDSFKIATLSRGYGRETKGFLYVNETDSAKTVGDEPLQFKTKYPDVTVAVSEDRVLGVKRLKDKHQIIILDDAYQHRALMPGFSILLLDYDGLFQPRLLLPAGDFRDSYGQRKRSDMIIVSKSPAHLSEENKKNALRKVAANPNQPVLFSFLRYGIPYNILEGSPVKEEKILQKEDHVLIVTGIANPKPLLNYVKENCDAVRLLSYPDHHDFTIKDINDITKQFHALEFNKKYILTTEKDFQRLKVYLKQSVMADLPIWVIPIEASFSDDDRKQFASLILNYCGRRLN